MKLDVRHNSGTPSEATPHSAPRIASEFDTVAIWSRTGRKRRMTSKVILTMLASVIPCLAGAQESTSPSPQPAGVQAQGNASAQGSTSVQRSGATAVQSQSSATGNASGSVSKGDKSASADGGAATNAVLSGSLDAKKAKPGDPVTAKTTEPTSTPDHGNLPKGTRLLGHVTEAKAAGSGEGQSVLAFTFDRAVLKDGREVPIHSTVRALAAADGAVSSSGSESMSGGGARSAMGNGAGGLGGTSSAVGGLGATAGGALGGAAGGAGRVTGGAAGSMGSTLGASSRALKGGADAVGGLDARGMLSSESHGVFGMKDVNLSQQAAGGSSAMITSASRNIRLESGTRILMSVEGSATRAPSTSAAQPASGNKP
jgi:hypothetical protein